VAIRTYGGDLAVGDSLPDWSRRTDLMNWNRFAAVNDEFVYSHMDDDAGRSALNPAGAFGMGNLRFSYLLACLRDGLGDEVLILEAGCRHTALNQKGDVLTVKAVVESLEPSAEGERARFRMSVVNQDGLDMSPGHAVALLPWRRH
jgi:acyl dehydratase